ncbi:MAG: hypothetical protein Pars2KO_00650 [Parasphingorhabdus sp.]
MTRSVLNDHVKRAEDSLRIQRERSLFFPDNLIFDNPAWELLLEIYIATETDYCISTQKLNESLSAPSSIISRWIDIFADRQYLIYCEKHGQHCVRLTERARRQCYAYLDAVSQV